MQTIIMCAACNGTEILRDAFAARDPDAGKWERGKTLDGMTCGDFGHATPTTTRVYIRTPTLGEARWRFRAMQDEGKLKDTGLTEAYWRGPRSNEVLIGEDGTFVHLTEPVRFTRNALVHAMLDDPDGFVLIARAWGGGASHAALRW